MIGSPPRLLFVAGTLGAGGAEKQLLYQVRALREAGAAVEVLSLDGDGDYSAPLRQLGATVTPLTGRGGRPGRLVRILSRARAFRPNIVQAAHTHANLYAWAAARATGALSIGALRGAIATSFELIGPPARWHLSYPDAIVANSHRAAAEMELRRRPGQALHVLENAIDLDALDRSLQPRENLRRMAGAGEGDVLALAVGSLRRNKRFDAFLRVVAEARQRVGHLKAAIVGDGPEMDAIAAELRREHLQGAVTLLGRHPDAVTLMAGADVFLLTSENEGLANTLLEAMAARLPSIVTPAGDAARVVQASRGGVLCAAPDTSMAAALADLAADDAARREMGARARRYVDETFALPLLWPRMRRMYRDIAVSANRRDIADLFAAEGWRGQDAPPAARRPNGRTPDFYDVERPVNRFLYEEYKTTAAAMLRDAGLSLDGARVLDVGCGHAQWLVDFGEWGVRPDRLAGIDLDPARIVHARQRLPGADLQCGNAISMPWADSHFDVVVQSTLFTSLLDEGVRRAIAREMLRVLRPGGVVLWYDFVYDNPRNPNVRGVKLREIAGLFPDTDLTSRRVTLAPPIARLVVPFSLRLAGLLDRIPLLRTHVMVLLQKPATGGVPR